MGVCKDSLVANLYNSIIIFSYLYCSEVELNLSLITKNNKLVHCSPPSSCFVSTQLILLKKFCDSTKFTYEQNSYAWIASTDYKKNMNPQ